MTAPKLTESQRRLLNEWIRNRPQGGFMFGPSVRIAKQLAALGLMHVDDNGYMRGNPERWWVTFSPEGIVQAARVRDEMKAEILEAWGAALQGES